MTKYVYIVAHFMGEWPEESFLRVFSSAKKAQKEWRRRVKALSAEHGNADFLTHFDAEVDSYSYVYNDQHCCGELCIQIEKIN